MCVNVVGRGLIWLSSMVGHLFQNYDTIEEFSNDCPK